MFLINILDNAVCDAKRTKLFIKWGRGSLYIDEHNKILRSKN